MNTLLRWLSFQASGQLSKIPTELLGNKRCRLVAEELSALGHLERIGASRWQIAPPVLAELPSSGQASVAVLCGARTPVLLQRLHAACVSEMASMCATEDLGHVSKIMVTARSRASIEEIGVSAGIRVQFDAARTLLACTPSIANWPRKPRKMIRGSAQAVDRFSRSKIRWVPSTQEEALVSSRGFYRFKRDWDWSVLLKTSENTCVAIDIPAGRLTVAAKLRVIRWAKSNCTLSIPKGLYPPRLIARALTLCSGAHPQLDDTGTRICFVSVPPDVLRLTLQLTELRLK